MEASENDGSFIHCQSTLKKPNRIFKGCISRFLGYNNEHAIWIIDIKWHILIKKSKLSETLTGAFPVAGGNMGTNVHTSRKAAGHPSYDSIYIMKVGRSNHGREKDSDLQRSEEAGSRAGGFEGKSAPGNCAEDQVGP